MEDVVTICDKKLLKTERKQKKTIAFMVELNYNKKLGW